MLCELGEGDAAGEALDALQAQLAERQVPLDSEDNLAYYYARMHAAVVRRDEVALHAPLREALEIAANQLRDPMRLVEVWAVALAGLAEMEEWGVLRLRARSAARYLPHLPPAAAQQLQQVIARLLADAPPEEPDTTSS